MPRKDPKAHAIYMREVWYPRNRARHQQLVRRNEASLREIVLREKELRGGCCQCGFDRHPAALDFHHRESENKLFTITWALQNGIGKARLTAEMAKCDLLCANCHRILHAEKRGDTLISAGRANGKPLAS
jgi:hypothetical protein